MRNEEPGSKTIGIDLGSNTLRATTYDPVTDTFGPRYGAIVKTADGLAQTGVISDAAVERIVAGLGQMREALPFGKAKARAVTTEALRRAANGAEVLDRIAGETGIRFEIIDGEEEARLTLRAVRHRLQKLAATSHPPSTIHHPPSTIHHPPSTIHHRPSTIHHPPSTIHHPPSTPEHELPTTHYPLPTQTDLVLIDIGGGSTEVTFAYGDEVIAQSFPLGIVTLSQSYPDLAAIEAALPEVMAPLERFVAEVYIARGRPEAFVATAGTPTTLAAMQLGMEYDTYDPERINGTRLLRHAPRYYLDELLSLPFARREEIVGVGRADLVTAGILIFDRMYKILGFEACTVIDDGLREGVALDLASE